MKTITYFLELASYFAGLININLEYVKRTNWPNRNDRGNSAGDSDLRVHTEDKEEIEGENFTTSEGISTVISDKDADTNGTGGKPFHCCNGVRPVHARNCKWYKPDISE